MKQDRLSVLPKPKRNVLIPENAKWLSGEGAGSWFCVQITDTKNNFQIDRFSPEGKLECSGRFVTVQEFDPYIEFHFTYPSHCAKASVIQKNEKISFVNL
tara:strand:+ start:467 stop:766 length:300 start_codon:yes stop_codon:yes gene_type:complete